MAHILILGGGAAGLAAALAAAQAAPAARVTVLERNPKVGKKLLATGNGRCNLDNTAIAPEKYFTADPAALRPLLAAVDAAAPLAWFEQLGLYTRTDEAGRVYPYSNQAADVLALLELHLQRHTVQLRTGCTVSTLRQSKGGYAVQLNAQDVGAVPSPAQPLPGEVVRILSVDAATGAVQTDTTPLPDLRPYVRSETVPTAATPGAVRADGQYGVAVRADATLTTVPATAAQLDRMTEAYAPLTPALLPYGVKKALTSAAGAAGWSAQEKAAALLQLGADDRFYSKAEADRKFGMGCTMPPATAAVLGGVKVGRGLTVRADGTLEMTAENLDTVLGFSLAEKLNQLRGVTDMNGKLVYTSDGAAGKSNKTMTVPDEVDYIVVRMAVPLECTTIATTGGVAAAAAADYGCTRIVRGGTAVAIVGGGNTYNLRDGVYCKGEALVKVSFAANGTVNIGVVDVNLASNDNAYPFNVEGYQYV